MTNEEKKIQTESFKEIELVIDKVEVNVAMNEEINKISFFIGDKAITWKPKVEVEEERDGIFIKSKKSMSLKDLPNKVKTIARISKNKGHCKCIVEYTQMTTEDDKKYYFIRFESQLEKWEILEDKAEVTTL